jgi:hypothetical protein
MSRTRTMQWAMEHGDVILSYPHELSTVEIEELEALFNLTIEIMLRRAKASRSTTNEGEIG